MLCFCAGIGVASASYYLAERPARDEEHKRTLGDCLELQGAIHASEREAATIMSGSGTEREKEIALLALLWTLDRKTNAFAQRMHAADKGPSPRELQLWREAKETHAAIYAKILKTRKMKTVASSSG